MSVDAIWVKDCGSDATPCSAEGWKQWVSAGRTRNWCEDDPIIDWLELFGEIHGYIPDTKLDGYLSCCDFRDFVFLKGKEFEVAVISRLERLAPFQRVGAGRDDSSFVNSAVCGSSPRAWGGFAVVVAHRLWVRFIPTGVGRFLVSVPQ